MAHHFKKVSHIKGLVMDLQEENGNGSSTSSPLKLEGDGNKILAFLLHVADISNCAKPSPIFEQWTDRCLEEFFRQGDKERELSLPISPLCDRTTTNRPDSQIGFITYVILPTFELVGKLIPDVATQIVPIIQSNLQYWQQQKALEGEASGAAKGPPQKKSKTS